jgi:hypothetical protein
MTTIYIVPIEPVNTRYTKQWYDHIPILLDRAGAEHVVIVDGEAVSDTPTPGAFLDFAATNQWKSSQLMIIAQLFREQKIQDGDKFLYTDAWNPTCIQLRYMAELFGKKIEIHGLWHAGSYDSQDFLGRLIGDKPWIRNAETSMFYTYDTNWFATRFHSNLFLREMFDVEIFFRKDETDEWVHHAIGAERRRIKITGWPMDYLVDALKPYSNLQKKQQICFPHRIAPEKQLEIFKDLSLVMPEYNWVVCQNTPLTKHEYHTILGESKVVFSAGLQETLGISACAEASLCNAIPYCPDRLSYSEIFSNHKEFLYPSEWTENWEGYLRHRSKLVDQIRSIMNGYDQMLPIIKDYNQHTVSKYFSADPLVTALIG